MLYINRQSNTPIYQQLYHALKQDIISSPFKRTPLPAIRTLAKELCVSKNTVDQVYQQLLAEGYIYSVPGSGYFCNDIGRIQTPRAPISNVPEKPQAPLARKPIRYNFEYGNLESRLFPWSKWRECIKEALVTEEANPYLVYGDKQGDYRLREALSTVLHQSRGVNCAPEQIVICSGVHDTLRILAALLSPKEFILGFEEPGYSTARNIFMNNNYQIQPISITKQGISYDDLVKTNSNLVYLTPSHQFPTGYILPIASRNNILTYINEKNGYVIEDDYDSEFRYKAMPIPSLQSLDVNDRVIYIGTFSKSFSPTIRVAYLVLPNRLLGTYQTVCKDHKTPVAAIIQYALYLFINKGYYVRHIRKVVKANEKKYNRIISLFNEYSPRHIKPITTESGVHLMLEIESSLSEPELLAYLEKNDIRLYPTGHYWLQPDNHPVTLQMGFASMSMEELENGVRHLFHVFPKS